MGMSWIGKGAIAIWNDITPEGRANFHDWHGREHIPERGRLWHAGILHPLPDRRA
jgi:hypothetical protein